MDKSTDQTAIIGKKIGDLIGDKHLSPIIAVYNFITEMKFQTAIIGDNRQKMPKNLLSPIIAVSNFIIGLKLQMAIIVLDLRLMFCFKYCV